MSKFDTLFNQLLTEATEVAATPVKPVEGTGHEENILDEKINSHNIKFSVDGVDAKTFIKDEKSAAIDGKELTDREVADIVQYLNTIVTNRAFSILIVDVPNSTEFLAIPSFMIDRFEVKGKTITFKTGASPLVVKLERIISIIEPTSLVKFTQIYPKAGEPVTEPVVQGETPAEVPVV